VRILVDTNIVLRWSDRNSPRHAIFVNAVDHLLELGYDVCCCAQVLIEFWAVATRPIENNGMGLSVADTERLMEDAKIVFSCLPEPPDIAERWQDIASRHQVNGKQAHDARLVALMLSHGITQLLTLNTPDFARYLEITPLTPAEVLSL
jgi:predicted nucleic acid-binding protein